MEELEVDLNATHCNEYEGDKLEDDSTDLVQSQGRVDLPNIPQEENTAEIYHTRNSPREEDGSTDQTKQRIYISLETAMNQIGFGKYQMCAFLVCGLIYATDAMEVMSLSLLSIPVQEEFQLTSTKISILSSAVFCGMLVGALLFGRLGDMYGRKNMLFIVTVMVVVAGLASAIATSFYFLVFTRAIVGVGVGGGHLGFSLFSEILPTKKRGFWLVVFEAWWSVGSVFAALVGYLVIPTYGWRWHLVAIALPSAFSSSILLFVLWESTRYYIAKGDDERANRLVHKIAKKNNTPLAENIFITSNLSLIHQSQAATLSSPEEHSPHFHSFDHHQDELQHGSCDNNNNNNNNNDDYNNTTSPSNNREVAIENEIPSSSLATIQVDEEGSINHHHQNSKSEVTEEQGKFLDLFASKRLTLLTIMVWYLWSSCTLIYYGVAIITPTYFSHLAEAFGGTESAIYLGVLITSTAEFPGIIVGGGIVDFVGRKTSLFLSLLVCGISLLLIIFTSPSNLNMILEKVNIELDMNDPKYSFTIHDSTFNYFELVGTIIACFARAGITAGFALIYLYGAEVYPTSIRATAIGTASSISRLSGIITPFVGGLPGIIPYIVYGGVAIISAVVSKFLPFEPQNVPLPNNLKDL